MRFFALIAAAAALFAGPAYAAGFGEFTGNWRNNDPNTDDITRLRITYDGGSLDVRAWGQCHPTDCDWGTVDAVAYSSSPAQNPASGATDIIAIYNPGFARKTLIITARPGNNLSYAVYTRFTDGSGRKPFVSRGLMRKHAGGWPGWPPGGPGWPPGGGGIGAGITLYQHVGYNGSQRFIDHDTPNLVPLGWNDIASSLRVSGPGAWEVCEHVNYGGRCRVVTNDVPNLVPGGWNDMISSVRRYTGGGGGGGGGLSFSEDCVGFNWANVQASFVGGQWKVVDGGHQLLAFGNKAGEAQRAKNIIRHYRFTEHCFIGRPNASMDYWKRNNNVPSGNFAGQDCTNNNPNTTEARFQGGQWRLVDGSHLLMSFGNKGAEARQAEEVVKHYGLNRHCFVGRPNASMEYWLSQ